VAGPRGFYKRRLVKADAQVEDGKTLKMLKRHLSTSYGMTPAQYREKWRLRRIPHGGAELRLAQVRTRQGIWAGSQGGLIQLDSLSRCVPHWMALCATRERNATRSSEGQLER
jgi:hypothetical protein